MIAEKEIMSVVALQKDKSNSKEWKRSLEI